MTYKGYKGVSDKSHIYIEIDKQAGAELCQAQVKLGLAKLDL